MKWLTQCMLLLLFHGHPGLAEETKATPPVDATLHRLIVELDDPNFEKREVAQKQFEALGEGALEALITARGKTESVEARERLDRLISKAMADMGILAHDNARRLAPHCETRFQKILDLYKTAPDFVKKTFWSSVRAAAVRQGEAPREDWEEPNLRARLGLELVLEESTLELKADGSGTYRHKVILKSILKSLTMHLSEGKKDPKEVDKEVDEITAQEFDEFVPPPSVKNLMRPEERENGTYKMAFSFPSIDRLNEALQASDLIFKPRFTLQKGPDGRALLQRALPWPDYGFVGIEFSFIDGVIERFTLKSEGPISRSTGKTISANEILFEGLKWDWSSPAHPAAEWGKQQKDTASVQLPLPQNQEKLPGGFAKAIECLASTNRTERRIGLYDLIHVAEKKDTLTAQEQQRIVEVLQIALEAERDLQVQLECREVLSQFTGKTYYLPGWIPTWRTGISNPTAVDQP